MGILLGILCATAIAFMVVGFQVRFSNVEGDFTGTFNDFSPKSMQYMVSQSSKMLSYEEWIQTNHYT